MQGFSVFACSGESNTTDKKLIQAYLLYVCITDPQRIKYAHTCANSMCETETNLICVRMRPNDEESRVF